MRLHRHDVRCCAAAAASSGHAPAAPDGTERLYGDGHFNTDPDYCETFGQDLDDGAALGEQSYRAKSHRPRVPEPAEYEPFRGPDDEYPLLLTTGRTSTTSTRGRRPPAHRSSRRPSEAWVELRRRAKAARLREGDLSRSSPARRGAGPCPRCGHPRASSSSRSTMAMGSEDGEGRAPQRADRYELGSGSKQPSSRSRRLCPQAPRGRRIRGVSPEKHRIGNFRRGRLTHLAHYLALLHCSQGELGDAFRTVATVTPTRTTSDATC